MRTSSQLLLTFLLNACWQIALIAALASSGSWLLRNSVARYRHWVWASALCLAFILPAFTASRTLFDTVTQTPSAVTFGTESFSPLSNETVPNLSGATTSLPLTFVLNQSLALALLGIYFAFLFYRIFKLIQAWQATRIIKRDATAV